MKKGWKPFSPENNLIQDSEGNEENGYPIPDSSKAKINDAKDPNDTHKNILKEEILQEITENGDVVDMVNQNIQEALKKFQDTKNKEYKMTQKKINELIEAKIKNKVKQRTL
jgi:uncharacterized protein YheU (UPF0270 family)